MYGTLSLSDLLASTTQSIIEGGSDYERAIWEVFDASLKAHNRILDEITGEFVERTTERLVGTGGISTMEMEDADEFSTPHAQKVTAGENLGFPMRLQVIGHQWTRMFFQETTPAFLAGQVVSAMSADRRRVTREIKRAIYKPTNESFVDRFTSDRPTIPVKALANADGMGVPVGPNGETFNAATHTHYLGTAAFAAANLDALILTVAEHYGTNDIVVVINKAQEAAVRGFAGFDKFVDSRIVQSQTAQFAEGSLDLFQYNNREIGLYAGAVVAVRPWAHPGYVVAYNRMAPKVLAMRERRPGSGDFVMTYEFEDHPLRSKGFQREFGVGVRNRWGMAVLDTANAVYTAPTVT